MDLVQFVAWVEHLGTAGAAIFGYLYWLERLDRKEMTALLLKLAPENVSAIKDAKASIDMLRVAIGGNKNGTGT